MDSMYDLENSPNNKWITQGVQRSHVCSDVQEGRRSVLTPILCLKVVSACCISR
jgi:hypothetical protein